MSFTDEERAAWHKAKQQRERRPERAPLPSGPPAAVCLHCGQGFGWGGGIVDDFPMCDICLGD